MDFSKIEESREDNSDERNRMVFHYDREKRLRRAPEIVRDYYSGKFGPYKGGILKSLVSTRANRLLFVTIIFAFGIIYFVNFFGPQKSSGSLAKVDVHLSAFSYDDSVYASVRLSAAGKKIKGNFSEGVPVSAVITAYDKDNAAVVEERLSGKYAGEELFLRTNFADYDIIRVVAVCNMLDSYSALESQVDRR